ncbi:MAG: site-specific DNA-methyltransferase [Patescibacteria group bacterium]
MPQIQFKGKQFVQNYHLSVKYHELIPEKEKSLTDKVSLHDNLIIHGDNLKALKALLPTYAGKVKCIYIDPPYNTGNENWVYNDNVSSPMMQDWLGKTVDREDLTRHDKWLCLMTPRLRLLRELLSEDGAIFISIDDNEQHRLRMMMDDIFGEENFLAELIWQKRKGGGNDSSYIATDHEYVCVYSKNTSDISGNWKVDYEDEYLKRYKEDDEFGRFYWDTLSRPGLNNPIVYDVPCPDGEIIRNGQWQISRKELDRKLAIGDAKIAKGKNDNWNVYHKVRMPEGRVFRSVITNVTNSDAANEMEEIFGLKKAFSNPKPSLLIRQLLLLLSDNDSIVLDSFAGSGTTAHAVLDLNKEDGGNRKFILIECEDYADNITAERVRRVINGVPKAKDEKLKSGLGGTFSYFELGKPIEMESILEGDKLPSYKDMARYVYYTATGEEFDESQIDEGNNFVGQSKNYNVFLFYKPEEEYLKNTALTLDRAEAIKKYRSGSARTDGKKSLVLAPTKYLNQDQLDQHKIDFSQLPFEIYRMGK